MNGINQSLMLQWQAIGAGFALCGQQNELDMSLNVVMRIECPHCEYGFFEPVNLSKPHRTACCAACGKTFVLDSEIEAMARLLGEAKAARKERERRQQELRAIRQAEQQRPSLTEVLKRLDGLLDKGGAEAKRRA